MNWIKKIWQKIDPKAQTVREFGFILSGFFVIVPLASRLAHTWIGHEPFHYWWGWLILGALTLILNFLSPQIIRLIYRIAMLFAQGISWVMMRVVCSVLFFLVFTPIGLLFRLFRKDLLNERIEPQKQSYWRKRSQNRPRQDYERLF